MEEWELIGKYIKDNKTGDIGQVIERGYPYHLVKWVYVTEKSWHNEAKKDKAYARYNTRAIRDSGRFEILTGIEAFLEIL
jgi:hypothetical protein